ncbi:MAG: hypothetical protein PWP08_1283 [Methanofollis sp.]|nr:hypothetical protein [Methanofollis sp.]
MIGCTSRGIDASIPHRTVSAEVLAAMRRSNPIEAAAVEILIERGVWTSETENEAET